jgi:hypothetical protein
MKIVGRIREQAELKRYFESGKPEFIAITGRRRIRKTYLGISGISTEVFSWRSKESKPGAQIDLLIDRKDGVINLCEMKYTLHPFTMGAKDDQGLQNKRVAFLAATGTRKAVHVTMVTTYGLTNKGYRASVQSEIVLDDLFF